jgi:hypothetical protein
MTRGFVMRLRDKAFKQHKRKFANYTVAVIQSVMGWAVDREYIFNHDIRNVKPIKRPKDMPQACRPWTREESEMVTAAAPSHLPAPILLCGVLGWREGAALIRPRTDYDAKTKRISRISLKSGKLVKTGAGASGLCVSRAAPGGRKDRRGSHHPWVVAHMRRHHARGRVCWDTIAGMLGQENRRMAEWVCAGCAVGSQTGRGGRSGRRAPNGNEGV